MEMEGFPPGGLFSLDYRENCLNVLKRFEQKTYIYIYVRVCFYNLKRIGLIGSDASKKIFPRF